MIAETRRSANMNRIKLILSIVLALALLLAIAFLSQVRKLQQQLRSSVSIVPTEPKSREQVMQTGFEESKGRPELLVKFRLGVSEEQISEITRRLNDRVLDEIEAVPGLVVIDDPDDVDQPSLIAAYQGLPEVEYAEPNYEITLDQSATDQKLTNDPKLGEQWWLAEIGAMEAWATTKGSDKIVVAVLDSGIEYTHADLKNNVWTRPSNIAPYQDRDLGTIDDVHGYNAVTNDGDPMDDNGHGTSCAGIIGAECGNSIGICGVNRNTKIMPLKFINAGGFGTVADALEAINYAINRKRAGVDLRIINASWGLTEPSRGLEDAIREAYDVGILVVAAGGRANAEGVAVAHYPAGYKLGNVISVAAVGPNGALASFSNYGNDADIAAPGEEVLTTTLGNEYGGPSGTSMSASVVSGVAALALSSRPELSVDQLRALLLESVDRKPALRGKVFTEGIINAARAVKH